MSFLMCHNYGKTKDSLVVYEPWPRGACYGDISCKGKGTHKFPDVYSRCIYIHTSLSLSIALSDMHV